MDFNDEYTVREQLAEAKKIVFDDDATDAEKRKAQKILDRLEQFVRTKRASNSVLSMDGGFPMKASSSYRREEKGDSHFANFGEFIQSAVRSSRPGYGADERLQKQQRELRAEYRAPTGMSEQDPAHGGFLIGKTFEEMILEKVYAQNEWLNLCDRREVGANSNGIQIPGLDETSRADGSRWGGVRGYWTNEAATITSSTPKYQQIEMDLEKLVVLVYLTSELLEDSKLVAAHVRRACVDELSFKLGNSILNGTGSGQPLGLLNANCLISVAKESNQEADSVVYENITNAWSRLWAPSKRNAVWLISSTVLPALYEMSLAVGTGGTSVFTPAGGASAQPFNTLFGRRIYETEFNPPVGDAGDVILADMSQYLLLDKGGVQSAMSMEVAFLADEVVLKFRLRTNGQPIWSSALTPFTPTGATNNTTTLSPFVAIAART